MPTTLATARADLQFLLQDSGQNFYPDATLNNWLNEGATNIARKAKCLWAKQSINVNEGQQYLAAPTNVVGYHRAEWLPSSSQNIYPLEWKNYAEMDSVWGIYQTVTQYYPQVWTIWGEPPNSQIVLYPVPSAPGTLNVFYYRTATPATTDASDLDVPEGYADIAVRYALYKGLFAALDPRWADVKRDFNDEMYELVANAQGYNDNPSSVSRYGSLLPPWAYGSEAYW